jgi:phospholipase/carboxylesterase
MRQVAGMQFLDLPGSSLELAPLVLLHGSGRREDDLLYFAAAIAPERSVLALRGIVPFDGGFAFFDRNPDRSLDYAEIVRATAALSGFLGLLRDEGRPRPILVGYSNGAIAAASLLASARICLGARSCCVRCRLSKRRSTPILADIPFSACRRRETSEERHRMRPCSRGS